MILGPFTLILKPRNSCKFGKTIKKDSIYSDLSSTIGIMNSQTPEFFGTPSGSAMGDWGDLSRQTPKVGKSCQRKMA